MSPGAGRHFLQIPGPTNVPDRVLRALAMPTIDHRGPEFAALTREVLDGLKAVFKTRSDVVTFPSSGTGAWEAALVNVLAPGERTLFYETGQFSTLWKEMAQRLGFAVDFAAGDWRHGVDVEDLERRLRADGTHGIKAVCVVHNETSTGITSDVAAVRAALDRAAHPALLLVDTVSSLASIDYRHDEWRVDVTVCGSQKGLMLPPGLGFNAVSARARALAKASSQPRAYWAWEPMIEANASGYFPYTPPTNLLFGLREALAMLAEEGLENVFARHARLAHAARAAVEAWGLELLALRPHEFSNTLTAVLLPDGFDADALRALILERYNMALGNGLGRLKGRVFRIGHLGWFNEIMLAGTLAGVQLGLDAMHVPRRGSGVEAALDALGAKRFAAIA